MGKNIKKGEFSQTVSMGDINRTIEFFFSRLMSEMHFPKDRIIPLIINLDLPDDVSDKEMVTLRKFLNSLRVIQNKFFLRFKTSLMWAAESECTDIFYTKVINKESHRDATLNVRVVEHDTVLIEARVSRLTRKHKHVSNLSKQLVSEINPLVQADGTLGYQANIPVKEFGENFKGDDFKLILIPSIEGGSYYTIPVYGLSLGDAERKVLAANREIANNDKDCDLFCSEDFCNEIALKMLLNLIQEGEEDGDRYRTANDSYALAELLYAYYVQLVPPSESDTENGIHIVLFETETIVNTSEIKI